MIASLSGKVLELTANQLVLDVQGVGYLVTVSAACAEKLVIGSDARVVTYTQVTQDALRLYGFADTLEKRVFELLLLVSGIGPKTAADILSRVDKRELLRVIGSGDVGRLQAIRGIGKKTAERIVVELRDKVAEFGTVPQENLRSGARTANLEVMTYNPHDEAVTALEALGFSRREAEAAVERARSNPGSLAAGADVGALVRIALQHV